MDLRNSSESEWCNSISGLIPRLRLDLLMRGFVKNGVEVYSNISDAPRSVRADQKVVVDRMLRSRVVVRLSELKALFP